MKFDKLVRLSKNINRVSPAASFVYAATELAGTGIAGPSECAALRTAASSTRDLWSPISVSEERFGERPTESGGHALQHAVAG